MLQFLPYALAAYGGYKGYRAAKDSGASGIGRTMNQCSRRAIKEIANNSEKPIISYACWTEKSRSAQQTVVKVKSVTEIEKNQFNLDILK